MRWRLASLSLSLSLLSSPPLSSFTRQQLCIATAEWEVRRRVETGESGIRETVALT